MKKAKLDPYMIEAICSCLRKGMTVAETVKEVGVSDVTYFIWQRDAKRLEDKSNNGEFIFEGVKNAHMRKHRVNLLNFLAAVREAKADYQKSLRQEFESGVKLDGEKS